MAIKIALADHPRARPLREGRVPLEGLELEFVRRSGEGFRGVSSEHFDVYEYSMSGYILSVAAVGQDARDWIALPLFISRPYGLLARLSVASGVKGWSDLGGRRIVVPDVGMTAAIWLRVIARVLYGTSFSDVQWWHARQPEERHTNELGFEYRLGDSEIHQIARDDQPLSMVANGTVDVALAAPAAGRPYPEGVSALAGELALRQVFEAFTQATGTEAINHIVLVRKSLLEAQPALARRLYDALDASKRLAYDDSAANLEDSLLFPGAALAQERATFASRPYPSGVATNESTIRLLMEQLVLEQNMPRLLQMHELFHPDLLDT